ncbi:MAG: LamG domain-containing protein, partial [Bacteroidetes bacterium]|nr:LamG domain-containing protein [Bacteroidota bacterium]
MKVLIRGQLSLTLAPSNTTHSFLFQLSSSQLTLKSSPGAGPVDIFDWLAEQNGTITGMGKIQVDIFSLGTIFDCQVTQNGNIITLNINHSDSFDSRNELVLSDLDLSFHIEKNTPVVVNGSLQAQVWGESFSLQPQILNDSLEFGYTNNSNNKKALTLAGLGTQKVESVSIQSLSADQTGLVALYDFSEGKGSIVHDISGQGKALNLKIKNITDVSWGDGFLTIDNPVNIISEKNASKISEACKNSNEISVIAWIRPANDTQKGPARIVSLSTNPSNRNFMLGQGGRQSENDSTGDHYDFRVRTEQTDPNGLPSLATASGTLTTDLTQVAFTRDQQGVNRLFINGELVAEETAPGNFSNWENDYELIIGNENHGSRPWLGEYHHLAIYSRSLSADEVFNDFQPTVKVTGDASFDAVPAPLNGPFPVVMSFAHQDIVLNLDSNAPGQIADNLGFSDYVLEWRKSGIDDWAATGSISVELFGQTISLIISLDQDANITLTLDANIEIGLDGLGAITWEDLIFRPNSLNVTDWEVESNGQIEIDFLPAPLNEPLHVQLAYAPGEVSLTIDSNETVFAILKDYLSLSNLSLSFSKSSDEWAVAGGADLTVVDVELNGLYAQFSAGNDGSKSFGFGWDSNPGLTLIDLPAIASLNISQLGLEVSSDGEGGREWSLSSSSILDLADIITINSTLVLLKNNEETSLALELNNFEHSIELPLAAGGSDNLGATFGITHIGIVRGKTSGWAFEAETTLAIQGFCAPVQTMIPDPIIGTFRVNNEGVGILVNRLTNPLDVPLPGLNFGEGNVDLGVMSFDASNLAFILGKQLSISAELSASIPRELNNIFGTENGQPKFIFFGDEVRIGLGINSKTGLSMTLLSSPVPPSFGGVEIDGQVAWQVLDLKEAGKVRFQLPVFGFNGKDFSAKGAFKHENLALPLGLVQNFLSENGMAEAAKFVPDRIALSDFDFLDENGDLDVSGLTGLIESYIPEGSEFPTEAMTTALNVIADRFNELPDAFQEYLRLTVPDEFAYDIKIGIDG